jgi:hypothetical protein
MAVEEVPVRISGVLIPDWLTRRKSAIAISSYALCSVFLDDRDFAMASGKDRYFISRRLVNAFSETVAAVSSDHAQIDFRSKIDRIVRLFQGETVVLGGLFDASEAIADLKLRGFEAAVGQKEAGGFRLSLEPEFVRGCFGEAALRVNGKEVEVSGAGLLLLRRSELTLDETPALAELISLLRLERVVPRDVSELLEVARTVGLEWAIDFDCAGLSQVSDPDRASPCGSRERSGVGRTVRAGDGGEFAPTPGGTVEDGFVSDWRVAERDRRAVSIHACEAFAMAGDVTRVEGDLAEVS